MKTEHLEDMSSTTAVNFRDDQAGIDVVTTTVVFVFIFQLVLTIYYHYFISNHFARHSQCRRSDLNVFCGKAFVLNSS